MKKRPKRRSSKDNPYELKIINNQYFVEFYDSKKELQLFKINKIIFDLLNEFELDDIRQMNYYDRHIEHQKICDEALYHRSFNKGLENEAIVSANIMKENLYRAINSLSDIQKIRIQKYYFWNMTLDEIAKIEGTTHQAISKSIKLSLIKMRKLLENW